jgi:hypothetical protein
MPYSLMTECETPGTVYAAFANGEVWQGDGHGERWEQLPFSYGPLRSVVLAPRARSG